MLRAEEILMNMQELSGVSKEFMTGHGRKGKLSESFDIRVTKAVNASSMPTPPFPKYPVQRTTYE